MLVGIKVSRGMTEIIFELQIILRLQKLFQKSGDAPAPAVPKHSFAILLIMPKNNPFASNVILLDPV